MRREMQQPVATHTHDAVYVPARDVEQLIDRLEAAASVWAYQAQMFKNQPKNWWTEFLGLDNSQLVEWLDSSVRIVTSSVEEYRGRRVL